MCTVTDDIDHTLQFHKMIHTEEHKERKGEQERGYRQKY